MKKLLLIIAMLIFVSGICYGANTQTSASTSNGRYEEAFVDTDPGANGHGCLPVNIPYKQGQNAKEMRCYIKSITGATVTLQWKFKSDSDWGDVDADWTDYEDYTEVMRKIIRDKSEGVYWRMIVKDNNQGTDSTFGISW